MNLREQILAIDDKKRLRVIIPEWPTPECPGGVVVYATTLSAARQIQYMQACKKFPDAPNSVIVSVFSAEDEAGNLIFTADDIPALADKTIGAFKRIYTFVNDNTPSEEDVRKNFSAPQ